MIRRTLLLLILLSTNLFASFASIYNIHSPDFSYSIENSNYRVYLSKSRSIDYKAYLGFKFYLPKFTKSFNLSILRFNSIGYISGFLSIYPKIYSSKILQNNNHNLKYYLSDYKSSQKRQLDYLLKGVIIPYNRVTSLAIEGLNIPNSINRKFNRWFYFAFDKSDDEKNKLRYLVYSYTMVLDKKEVDRYVKKYLQVKKYSKNEKFNYIYTYINSLGDYDSLLKREKIVKKYKNIKSKKKSNNLNRKKNSSKLNIKRFLYMKDFGYSYVEQKCNDDKYQILNQKFKQLKKKILLLKNYDGMKDYVLNYSDTAKSIKELKAKIIDINNTILSLKERKENKDNCNPTDRKYKINCLKNQKYIANYIYFAIKKDSIPEEEFILGYGDGKIFNDIGKYYFEKGEYQEAEKYLFKSYVLLPTSKIVSYNLGVLYSTINTIESNKKAIKYFKKAELAESYFNLGVNYYIGLGVKEDNKKALKYFSLSAKEGLKRAKDNVKKMHKMYKF